MKTVLTDKAVKNLKPAPPGRRYIIHDVVIPAFGVRVTSKGHKSYVLGMRAPGSKNYVRRELGEVGAITLAEARTVARQWLELVKAGKDPKHERESAALVAAREDDTTFRAVAERYIAVRTPSQRKGIRTAREIRRELIPHLGSYQIGDIARRDIIKLIERIAVERKAAAFARNVLSHIKTIYSFAIARDLVDHAPTDHVRSSDLIGKRNPRTRVLSDDEIRSVWRAADQIGYPYGLATQLLLLTGARSSEISRASWEEVDLTRCTLTIPGSRYKIVGVEHVYQTRRLGSSRSYHGGYLVATYSRSQAGHDQSMVGIWQS